MTAKKDSATTTVATRITKPMLEGIQSILMVNAHINIADYIRDLIRKDLEERGILKEKEADSRE
jgi:Arc/MetJ-type ribon-helix-helix transcriptional regulator